MTKRILVVEDQADLRGVLRDLLTGSGYEVVEAADGGEGVAKAKSERPDLILMDIQLPVLDGYETTRQIKADPDFKAIPIIAVSSYAMKGDEEKARGVWLRPLRHEALQPRSVVASFEASGGQSFPTPERCRWLIRVRRRNSPMEMLCGTARLCGAVNRRVLRGACEPTVPACRASQAL